MIGADYRIDQRFGIGPWASLSVGQYGQAGQATHEWFMLGPRLVFFP